MLEYIYFVKCPNCEDEPFDFFDEAKSFAINCLSKKPIITQIEVNRNDFGECTDSCDLGTVWSWEDMMNDVSTEQEPTAFSKAGTLECTNYVDPEFDTLDNSLDSVPDNFRKPVPADMSIEGLVEAMEENEDTVECKVCEELFNKQDCHKDSKLGWVCEACKASLSESGATRNPYNFEYSKKGDNYVAFEYLDLPIDAEYGCDPDSGWPTHARKAVLPYYTYDVCIDDILRALSEIDITCPELNVPADSRDDAYYEKVWSLVEQNKVFLFNYFEADAIEHAYQNQDTIWDNYPEWHPKHYDPEDDPFKQYHNPLEETLGSVQSITWDCFFDDNYVGTVDAATTDEAEAKMMDKYPEYPYSLYDGCFYVEPQDVLPKDTLKEPPVKPFSEAIDPRELVELEYPSLTVTLYGPQRDVDDWDEVEHTNSHVFLVSKAEVATAIWENWITEEDVRDVEGGLDALEDDTAWEKFLETHFDILFEKYNKQILEYFEDEAEEDFRERAQEDYSLGRWYDNSDAAYEEARDRRLFDENVQKPFLEELEEPEVYRKRLVDCPECGVSESFDHRTGICIKCGFNRFDEEPAKADLEEAWNDKPKLVNEDGFMSSLNNTVGSELANKTVGKNSAGNWVTTKPANQLEYNRRVLNDGRDREFSYILATGVDGIDRDDILSSDVYKGFMKVRDSHKSRNDLTVEHRMNITKLGSLVYTVTLKPASGHMLYDPHDKAFMAEFERVYGDK